MEGLHLLGLGASGCTKLLDVSAAFAVKIARRLDPDEEEAELFWLVQLAWNRVAKAIATIVYVFRLM